MRWGLLAPQPQHTISAVREVMGNHTAGGLVSFPPVSLVSLAGTERRNIRRRSTRGISGAVALVVMPVGVARVATAARATLETIWVSRHGKRGRWVIPRDGSVRLTIYHAYLTCV